MTAPIRVLMITSHWPTPGQPRTTYFIKRQADFLRAAGVDVDVFHFQGRRNPWNYLSAWWRLHHRLVRNRYDLMHAQFGHAGLLAFPKRLALVVTYRGSDLLGEVGRGGRYTLTGRILQRVSRAVARRADAVIVVSEHMKEELPPGVPFHVIPSGLDFELFRPIPRDEARRHLGLALDRRLVLFAGSPDWPRKRFALAQAAMERVDHRLGAELVVAWGAPHTDIPYFMSACDTLLFTSMQEGSPNVVKEALACDLPVVSVPVGDVATRLAGVAGCELCADERPETIAAALERVLRRGGRCAGRAAVQELDERLLTQRVIDIYRSVMRRPSRPAPVVEAPHALP
jgi:glycosyltransferase involved in cell wall biosynthesis